jgi:esterase/lipase superfamily enzyme
MATSRRARIASLSRAEIRSELVKFFKARLLKPAKIGANSNVKKFCGYEQKPKLWRALARTINRLPSIRENGLRLTAATMANASTIGDILRELFREAPGPRKPPRRKARRRKGYGGVAPRTKTRITKQRKKKTDSGRILHFQEFSSQRGQPWWSGFEVSGDAIEFSDIQVRLEPQDDAKYVVWYGTNRALRDQHDPSKGYSAKRDPKVHLGICQVFIPKSHKIGSLGSSWWERVKSGVDDRLKILSTTELLPKTYWAKIAARLNKLQVNERDAVIFVHGYNVSFEDAALRAAQIGFDLSIKGCMAFFSWPSQGALSGYMTDEASIEASELAIMQFMIDVATRSRAPRVHIIAHSMGNRGVLRAVDRMASRAEEIMSAKFGQIILAAADVDADTFRNLCAAYVGLSQRTTLYVSTRDLAVEASQWLHTFPRAGLLPPIMIAPGIDTINVTNSDLTALGHGYVADSRDVLQDMHQLLAYGDPPERRFGLHEDKTDAGERYWLIRQ